MIPIDAKRTAWWGAAALGATFACGLIGLVFGFALGVKLLTFFGLALVLSAPVQPGPALIGAGLVAALDAFSRVLVFKGGLLPWNTFGYVLLFVLVLLLPRELPYLTGTPVFLAGAFAALLLVELVPSEDRLSGVQHVFGFVAFFAFLLLAHRAATDRSAWLWTGAVAGIAAALFGLLYIAHGSMDERVNKNAWAFVPLTGLALLCPAVAVTGERRRVRVLLTLLAALDTAVVFLSESRGTFVVALCLFAYVLVAGADTAGERLRRLGLALLLSAPVAVGVLVAFPEKTEGMSHRLDVLADENRTIANRTSGRSDLARIGWEIATAHPLGIGTGSFSAESGTYGSREAMQVFHGGRELQAHSAWVKTLAENGYPGLLLLGAFVVSFAVVGSRRKDRGVFGLGLLATAVLATAFASTEFQPKGIWLFAAIAALALERGRVRTVRAPARVVDTWRASGAA